MVLELGHDLFVVTDAYGFLLQSGSFFAGTDEYFCWIRQFLWCWDRAVISLLLPTSVDFCCYFGSVFAGTDESFFLLERMNVFVGVDNFCGVGTER